MANERKVRVGTVDEFISSAKAAGLIDRDGYVTISFENLCSVMRKLEKSTEQAERCTCGAMKEAAGG